MQFFKDPDMNFELLNVLGFSSYGASEIGEVVAIAKQIKDGDCDSWFDAFFDLAQAQQQVAKSSKDPVSIRECYLKAANYYAVANSMVDGTRDARRQLPTWRLHLECWNAFADRLPVPVQRFKIPYQPKPMPAWFFRASNDGKPRPTIIFNNGSDGATSYMWAYGISSALARGYNAITFDGPGQNTMLWEHQVPFRHDWEVVITPLVDFFLKRPEIDKNKLIISGLSQAGYWILRALAFEHRIAAGIADPAVMDVSTSWTADLMPADLEMIQQGKKAEFDQGFEKAMKNFPVSMKKKIEWRRKPYGTLSLYEVYRSAMQYHLRDVVSKIQCPIFIADPEDEQFWPGQSEEVGKALKCPYKRVQFKRSQGANWHCEPLGRARYDREVFNWLSEILK